MSHGNPEKKYPRAISNSNQIRGAINKSGNLNDDNNLIDIPNIEK